MLTDVLVVVATLFLVVGSLAAVIYFFGGVRRDRRDRHE